MNTARFLFCLNSDDPDIVAQGLEEFSDQVLKDHGAVVSYGYHGRGSSDNVMQSFHPVPVASTVGTLASFIKSSPQLEELFILWGLPGRDDDKQLSSSHMSCMAVILHAASSNNTFCSTVVNRILHEHSKSITSQLSSGNTKLVHSTLALVLAMCRTSQQNCQDTFQKLVTISPQTFSSLLQHGKGTAWEGGEVDASGKPSKLKTDARLLVIIIAFTAVEAADQSSGADLHSSNSSFLRRITNSITKDTPFSIQFILEVLEYLRRQPAIEQHIGARLVDIRFQDNLLYLYHNEDAKVQRVVHSFLLNHSSHLVAGMSKSTRGSTAGSAKGSALQLLRGLEGHRDLRHREIQMMLLKAQPSLLSKSIASIVLSNWEPHPTIEYYCALSQLTFLCSSVDIDSQFRSALRAQMITAGSEGSTEKDVAKSEGSIRSLTSSFVQAMIPLGFQKKDISKLLQHKNSLLQRSGLLYVLSVMQRVMKATVAAASAVGGVGGLGRTIKIERLVAAAVHKLLPDFQLLLNIRSKYAKAVTESTHCQPSNINKSETGEPVEIDTGMEMDVDAPTPSNAVVDEANEGGGDGEKALYLLSLVLRIIEYYVKAVPSLVAGFELTKLLEDAVSWTSKQSAYSAAKAITADARFTSITLGPVIRSLKHATTARQCKWFGTSEDCVKLATQLIVNQDWEIVVKRSPLAKLLLLVSCRDLETVDAELYASVCLLVKAVLRQSGMFQGHGETDLELRNEQGAWLDALTVADSSILMLDSILKITHHWNTEYCIEAAQRIGSKTGGVGYHLSSTSRLETDRGAAVSPFSPVISCAMNLCCNNFNVLASNLPRHIRVHVDASRTAQEIVILDTSDSATRPLTSTVFLFKYSQGFRSELQQLLVDVILTVGPKSRNPARYGQCVIAAVDVEAVAAYSDVSLLADITSVTALLSSCADRSSSSYQHGKTADDDAAAAAVAGMDVQSANTVIFTAANGEGEGSSVVELLLRVLDKTMEGGLKRPRKQQSSGADQASSSATDNIDTQTPALKMRLDSTVIAFIIRNIQRVIACYDALIKNVSQTQDGIDSDESLFIHCLDKVGFFCAHLYCTAGTSREGKGDGEQGSLGLSFYQWVSAMAVKEKSLCSQSGGYELERSGATVVQCVRLLRVVCDSLDTTTTSSISTSLSNSTRSASKETPAKRKRQLASTVDRDSEIKDAAAELTSLIVELVRHTSCAPLLADALNSSGLLEGMMKVDLYGKMVRRILCAAASAYFKRVNSRSKVHTGTDAPQGSGFLTLPLWTRVAEQLLVMQAAHKGSGGAAAVSSEDLERDTFSLGWMVQHFVDNAVLRSQFVDLALMDGQGHSLLKFSAKSAGQSNSFFSLVPLDNVSMSVLSSASVETLASALESFTQSSDTASELISMDSGMGEDSVHHDQSSAVNTGNALCCVTISIGTRTGSSLPRLNTFISPLNLMTIQKTPVGINSALTRLTSLCSTLSDAALQPLPVCVGSGALPFGDTIELIRQPTLGCEHFDNDYCDDNCVVEKKECVELLHLISDTESPKESVRSVSAICDLLLKAIDTQYVEARSYILAFLAAYTQSDLTPQARTSLLKGPLCAVTLACSLPTALQSDTDGCQELSRLWAVAYNCFMCSLLDNFTACLAAVETSTVPLAEQTSQLGTFFTLLQSMLFMEFKTNITREERRLIDEVGTKSDVRKKLNKWIKSTLKFGLHLTVVTDGLSAFYAAARNDIRSSTHKVLYKEEQCFWRCVYNPVASDFYHPSLVLQMVISHSKFTHTLRSAKSSQPSSSLLRLLLALLSLTLPALDGADLAVVSLGEKNGTGSGADQFLVGALLQLYQGTMSEADRTILRILHLLNSADKCPALCTLYPVTVTLLSKKSTRAHEGKGNLLGSVLPQLVYSTVSHYPVWRACAPQPLDLEGLPAEQLYRQQFSALLKGISGDWVENNRDEGRDHKDGTIGSGGSRLDTSADNSVEGVFDEEGEDEEEEGDTDSVKSIVSVKNSGDDWSCTDSDTYIPSTDSLLVCDDKVYDPCFWLPALHHTLLQEAHSVRQLANTGALSLVIAGVSSRCPVLRALSMSSLQRILDLAKQQTPDKDASFKERPQLLLLMYFLRNALDSFVPSSSGPTQFPSVISLFLSRAAMHLLQPSHELFSKINKYLLSRPFCDVKDVPLYDLLLVDGDASTEQAARLTTFRIVRDGLTTRWDHLNLCRKNAYNRLMLLFPVLGKDVKAGHAVFDLLDKALGMQVSARYLLERCSIVSWLQQMASPTNSLDIDTSGSARTNKTAEENDVREKEEEEAKRGTRTVVTRSQPSVLLAAPPRLLSRVLCLMRRALGASYLLSAGESNFSTQHMDQILMAIITLIDDVIAVDRVGMATEISSEFFRQLVLLMWDYALCSSGGGGDGAGDGLKWGLDRVFLLATAIQHSSRAAADHSTDDLVMSLLSLLAFKTASGHQGAHLKTSRCRDLCEMVLGCALKHLILPHGGREGVYAIAPQRSRSVAVLHDSSSTSTSTSMSYQCVINILSQDNTKRKIQRELENSQCLLIKNRASSTWRPQNDDVRTDVPLLLHDSWEHLAHTGYESMALPVSMGKSFVLCMAAKALLSIATMSRHNDDMPSPDTAIEPAVCETTSTPTLDMARWALTMRAAFLRPTPAALDVSCHLHANQNTSLVKRALSSSDGSSFDSYSAEFIDFQLTYRLAVITLSDVVEYIGGEREPSQESVRIRSALLIALKTLLNPTRSALKALGSESVSSILQSQCDPTSQSNTDSSHLWNGSMLLRRIAQKTCSRSLDLCAALVTSVDRNSAMGISAAITRDSCSLSDAAIKGHSVSGRSIVNDASELTLLCKRLVDITSPSDAAESPSAATHTDDVRESKSSQAALSFQDCFDPLPGKDKTRTSSTGKRNSVLFDRTSGVWREGGSGAMDRVLASMRAGQGLPLCGIRLHSLTQQGDEEEDDEEEEGESGTEGDDSDYNVDVDDSDDDLSGGIVGNDEEDEEKDEDEEAMDRENDEIEMTT